MKLMHPPRKVVLKFICQVEVRERGTIEWLPFTDAPVPEWQAEKMIADIEKNYSGIEARAVSFKS